MHSQTLTDEIAATAACLIAEEGLDYAAAKKKAVKQMGLTDTRVSLPDNSLIEQQLRQYQAQYQSDSQPAELLRLRQLALLWMQRLAQYNPYVMGAVWNGTASEHSAVHLILLTDDEKMLEIELRNREIMFSPTEVRHLDGRGFIPAVVVEENNVPVVLSLYSASSVPVRVRNGQARYGNIAALCTLLEQGPAFGDKDAVEVAL